MGKSGHVSEERLVEVCLDRASTQAEDAHFSRCEACASRRAELESFLRDVSEAAMLQADAAFPDERLATQHARILQRLEQLGRPARVLAFPATEVADQRPLRARPAARWIAGAAAAGLALGLLLGHVAHDFTTFTRLPGQGIGAATARPASNAALRAVNASMNDEEFLGEVETAVAGPRLVVLRPLNDLTPQ